MKKVAAKPHEKGNKHFFIHFLTWIGLKIGTSTGGLSRWLRGRGRQVPQWGEISSIRSGRGRRELISGGASATWRRATWTPAHAIGKVAEHRRKWLIHIWRWGTSCGRQRIFIKLQISTYLRLTKVQEHPYITSVHLWIFLDPSTHYFSINAVLNTGKNWVSYELLLT